MGVLGDQHDGAPSASRGRQALDRGDDAAAALDGIQRGHARVARVHRQEITEQGLDARRVLAEEFGPVVDLGDDLRLGVLVLDAEVALEHLDDRQERRRLAERDAVALDPGGRLSETPAELEQEPGLSDARVADHEHRLAAPRPRLRPRALEGRQRVVAADERRQAARGPRVEPRDPLAHLEQLVRGDGLALALHGDRAERARLDVPAHEALRGLGQHDLAGSGELLHARRRVGRVADRGVVHSQVVADRPDDDEPGVEAHAHAEVDPARPLELVAVPGEDALHPERRVCRAPRVVLVGHGCAEEGHEPVPEELVDGALVAVDLDEHQLERAVDEGVDVLGIEGLGEGREAGGIGEEHRDLLALARERGAVLQDPLGQVGRRVRRGRREARGERLRHGRRRAERRAARAAEFFPRRDAHATGGAQRVQPRAALLAELHARAILRLARGTTHRGYSTPGGAAVVQGRPMR